MTKSILNFHFDYLNPCLRSPGSSANNNRNNSNNKNNKALFHLAAYGLSSQQRRRGEVSQGGAKRRNFSFKFVSFCLGKRNIHIFAFGWFSKIFPSFSKCFVCETWSRSKIEGDTTPCLDSSLGDIRPGEFFVCISVSSKHFAASKDQDVATLVSKCDSM